MEREELAGTQDRQLVEQLGRRHLAGQAAAGHVGWHRERLDQKTTAVCCVPHHQAKACRHGNTDHRRRHAQQHAQPLFPDTQMQLLKLFVQMVALVGDQGPLVGSKSPLLAEKRVRFLAARTAQGKRHGDRINTRSVRCLGAGRARFQAFRFFHPAPTA